MAIDKRSRPQHPLTITIRDHHQSSPNAGSRCFSLFSKSASSRVATRPPSILRRHMKYSKPSSSPLRLITSRVNNSRNNTTILSCSSSAGKRIKIILHHNQNDYNDETVPASFTPPPSNTLMVRPKPVTPPRPVPSNNVSFYHKVQVMRIPSRKQYPEDIKKSLWASLSEISENARRNSIEYTAEGWDWRTVLEEDDMYVHPRTGEHVHPVHVQREYQKRMKLAHRQQNEEQQAALASCATEPKVEVAAA
ncbi:hypothetical protein IV203_003121 [Nitzschia inconspicua]|uniref:Uncharacterized protein n=1 Tax=Nitzschia inconspicua TaxID=303405 RepID=A0A9K3L2Y2_9STRA|nr:hypothetical protein IV203_003121 [Nitzschia inconspicua]